MMKTLALALVVVAACGGGTKSEPKKPEPAPIAGIKKMPTPTCAATSDTMSVVILASNDAMPSDTEVKEIKAILKTRCESDGWSDRAKECLATMESEADADGCASMLTAEQRNKIVADERIKLGGGKPPEANGAKPGVTKPGAKQPNMAGVIADLEKFRDKMCACKDGACGEKVNNEFMKWAQELEKLFGPDFKPEDKDQEKLGKLVMEFGQCYSKLMTSGDDAPRDEGPLPPPPPKAKGKAKGTSRGGAPKKPAPKSSDPDLGGE